MPSIHWYRTKKKLFSCYLSRVWHVHVSYLFLFLFVFNLNLFEKINIRLTFCLMKKRTFFSTKNESEIIKGIHMICFFLLLFWCQQIGWYTECTHSDMFMTKAFKCLTYLNIRDVNFEPFFLSGRERVSLTKFRMQANGRMCSAQFLWHKVSLFGCIEFTSKWNIALIIGEQ